MRDEIITDVDRQIQEALAVDPSPDFQARVLIRLSEEPQRHGLGMGWLQSGVIGLAAVAALSVFVSSRDDVGPRAGDFVAPPTQSAAALEPVLPPASEQPVALPLRRPTRVNAAETVLVPAAEREAFRRFLRTVTENGFPYAVALDARDDAPLSVPEITIDPILIAPIDSIAE
jgi:hypothetical protein